MAVAGAAGAFMDYGTPSAAVRALALARAGGRYAERLVNHDTTLRILSTIRVWFFRRIEPLAPARLQDLRSGDLLGRIRADVDTLDDFYVRGLVPSVVAVLALALIVPFLLRFDARVAVVDVAALACGGVILPLFLRRLSSAPGRERVALSAGLRASSSSTPRGSPSSSRSRRSRTARSAWSGRACCSKRASAGSAFSRDSEMPVLSRRARSRPGPPRSCWRRGQPPVSCPAPSWQCSPCSCLQPSKR